MLIAVLVLLQLLFGGYCIGKIWPGIRLEKMLVFDLTGFFFLYTVVSGLYFWIDCFAFVPTLISSLAIIVALSLFLLTKKSAFQVSFDVKALWVPLVIMLIALPFTWNKFELYSMGQDQGTYQVKALYLMERDTHNYITMGEFEKLQTPEEKQKYLEFIYDQNNFYLPKLKAETDMDASHFTQITGTIHGLPTYSALLGLWGKIFGYAQMIGVQTILYLCLIFMTYFVCENLNLKKMVSAVITALMAFSPIILWLSKSSLTEVGLTLIVLCFLYFFTEKDTKEYVARPAFLMFPMIAFSFFHISLFAFMPIIVLVIWIQYAATRRKGYLYGAIGSAIGYAVGSIWAFMIAPYYAYGNYNELTRVSGGLFSVERLIPVVIVAAGIVVGISAFFLSPKGNKALDRVIGAVKKKSTGLQTAGFWLMRLLLVLSALFFFYKGVLQGETHTAVEYLQISTFAYMSGVILIPLIYLGLFFAPKRVVGSVERVNILLLFLYCIVIYSMVMRVSILYYYYFARYAAMFLIVIFLMAAFLLEKHGTVVSAGILFLALLTFVPYDKGMITQKDHSRCEWSFLGDVAEYIGENDAFIVGPEEQQIVFIFPIKILTGCDVYYAADDLGSQLAELANTYDHVYYMDYDTVFTDNYQDAESLKDLSVKQVYTNWNHLSYLDYFNIDNPLTPIPIKYVEYRLKLSLYEIQREE